VERLTPTGVTQAQRDARVAEEAIVSRKARVIEKMRERGFQLRDDLEVLAYAIRDLYQQSGLTPPQPLRDWWQAFQDAENEVNQEEG